MNLLNICETRHSPLVFLYFISPKHHFLRGCKMHGWRRLHLGKRANFFKFPGVCVTEEPPKQGNAHLNLDNSSLNRHPKPSGHINWKGSSLRDVQVWGEIENQRCRAKKPVNQLIPRMRQKCVNWCTSSLLSNTFFVSESINCPPISNWLHFARN